MCIGLHSIASVYVCNYMYYTHTSHIHMWGIWLYIYKHTHICICMHCIYQHMSFCWMTHFFWPFRKRWNAPVLAQRCGAELSSPAFLPMVAGTKRQVTRYCHPQKESNRYKHELSIFQQGLTLPVYLFWENCMSQFACWSCLPVRFWLTINFRKTRSSRFPAFLWQIPILWKNPNSKN